MDLPTLQAIATVVNQIGLPATIGVICVIAAWNLLPVLSEYLRAKIEVNRATTKKIQNGTSVKS